jgi:hypothetical protein
MPAGDERLFHRPSDGISNDRGRIHLTIPDWKRLIFTVVLERNLMTEV